MHNIQNILLTKQLWYRVKIDGVLMDVLTNNRQYAEIMRQVKTGQLTIAEADDKSDVTQILTELAVIKTKMENVETEVTKG